MDMTPRVRKLALLAHITFSVGWLGAIAPYLALAIAGLTSHDAQMVRANYLSMELIGWYVIVPFSLAALLTGVVQSLGTRWGLLRHWWIVAKFLLTIVAVVVLLLHMRDVSRVARMTEGTMLSSADLRPELIHAAGGLLVLLAVMALSVFKPWGMTPDGRRKLSQGDLPARAQSDAPLVRKPQFTTGTPRWARVVGIHAAHAIAIVLLLVVILHLTGGGMRHH